MSDPFVGQIEAFAFNFAPKGWAQCNGQLLSIQQNAALFSLLGTYYGGNGTSNFALPDLRGRLAVSQGLSPGGSTYGIGESVGTETVTLVQTQMPAHSHTLNAVNNGLNGGTGVPSSTVQLGSGIDKKSGSTTAASIYAPSNGPQVAMESLLPSGGSTPHSNMMPYLTINYCIALIGVYPSRG